MRDRFFITLALVLTLTASARAALQEHEVKAAVVYHLSLFTEWPPGSLNDRGFNLCVLTEDDQMADTLAQLGSKTVKGAPVQVRRLRPTQALGHCQLVYLGEMNDSARARAIKQLFGQPTLTIANGGIPVPGAMVSLGVSADRVYFDIDLPVAQRAGLRLDAKLLRLARSVSR